MYEDMPFLGHEACEFVYEFAGHFRENQPLHRVRKGVNRGYGRFPVLVNVIFLVLIYAGIATKICSKSRNQSRSEKSKS